MHVKRIGSFLIVAALIAGVVGCASVECHLTIASTPGGSVTTPGEGTFAYNEGEVVELLAEAEQGYQFINWTGDVDTVADVNDPSTTITMEDWYFVTANFETYEMGLYSTIYVPSAIKVMMDDGSVEIMNLDDYVNGVVAAEMGSDWPVQALKAQAVAARTFAVSNTHHDHCNVDVCTDPNCCQAWTGPPYDSTIVDAVTSTCNEVITYNGTIIEEALFFSHCNGDTRNSEDYNGWGYVPYLRGVPCGCADEYGWTDHSSHGVGMCQYGARVMAEQGFSYIDILKRYYSGVAVAPAHTGQIVVRLGGPAELEVYETQERVTSLVDGDVKTEMPYSDYLDYDRFTERDRVTPNYPNDFDVYSGGNRTLVACYQDNLIRLYDTSDKADINEIENIVIADAHDVKLIPGTSDYAYYVTYASNKFGILDLTDEENLAIEDEVTCINAFYCCPVQIGSRKIVFVLTYSSNELKVFEVTRETISLLTTFSGSGANYDVRSAWRVKYNSTYGYAIVGAYTDGTGAVSVFDVSDPDNITAVGKYTGANYKWACLFVEGNKVYGTASATDKVVVCSIDEYGTLTKLGQYQSSTYLDNAHGVYVESSIIYAASWFNNGITVLDATDPEDITYVTSHFSSSLTNGHAIHKVGNYVWYAAATDVVAIFEYPSPIVGSMTMKHFPGSATWSENEGSIRVTSVGDNLSLLHFGAAYDHTATIWLPLGSYTYEIAGVGEGSYGLEIAHFEDDETTVFVATDIPVASGTVHHYTIDWDALAQEEKGVTVQVNEDGDDAIDYTLTAGNTLTGDEFVPSIQYDLTISSTVGGSVTTPDEGAFTYDAGAVVDLVAEPGEGYQFIEWTGDVSAIADIYDAETTVTMNEDYSIRANFEQIPQEQFDLTISSGAGGSVTTPGEGAFSCDEGVVIILVATPACGYQFINWTGNVGTIANINAAITTITMNRDYAIKANFQQIPSEQFDLTISSTAGGSVTTPGEGTFTRDAGTVVSLAASPASGYHFVNWIGDVGTIANVNAASTTITMNDDYSITAVFTEDSPSPPGISYTEAEVEQLIIVLVNAERQQFGLPALSVDALLTSLAREHSISMVVNNFFSHDRYPGERSFGYGQPPGTMRGENIVMIPTRQMIPGPYLSLQEVCEWAVSAWMGSSGHRENILEPCYTKTGVGASFSEGAEYLYITQMFEGAY